VQRLARWIAERLLEQRDGKPRAPGSSAIFRSTDVNGEELTLLSNGETFDVFQGRGRIHSFSIPSRTLIAVARFLLLWWARDMWFGLKPSLWRWAQRRGTYGHRS